MKTSDHCIICLNDEAHNHNADGVCDQCQYVNRTAYEEVLELVSPVGEATT